MSEKVSPAVINQKMVCGSVVLCLNAAQCTFAQVTQYSLFAKYTISDFAHFWWSFTFTFIVAKLTNMRHVCASTFAQFAQHSLRAKDTRSCQIRCTQDTKGIT